MRKGRTDGRFTGPTRVARPARQSEGRQAPRPGPHGPAREHGAGPPVPRLIPGTRPPPPNRRGPRNVLLVPTLCPKGTPMRAKRLTLQQRREIFSALVTAQDQGTLTVSE